ncbi:MAG: substrate-binding domain-containing protein [Planctomycetota bacterium]
MRNATARAPVRSIGEGSLRATFAVVLAATSLALTAAGCTSSAPDSAAVYLAILAADGDPRSLAIANALQDEADARGIVIDIQMCKSAKQQRRLLRKAGLRTALRAVLLQPAEPDGWQNSFAELRETNLPVLLLDRDIADSATTYATLVSGDPYDEGRLAAEHIVRTLPESALVVELYGAFDAGLRSRAVADTCDRLATATITNRRSGLDPAAIESLADFLTQANPPINAIFAHNPAIADAALRAIAQSERSRRQAAKKRAKEIEDSGGRAPQPIQRRRYEVVTVGGDGPTLVSVVDQGINATIDTPVQLIASAAFQALGQLERRSPLQRRTTVPSRLLGKDDALRLLSAGRQ